MIEINNVTKYFIKYRGKNDHKGEHFKALDDISFQAQEGKIISILGPNGAGKTTLLRIIAGLMEPSQGSLKFGDLDYQHHAQKIKSNLAYLSGNTKLYNSISPYELLLMCEELYDVPVSLRQSRLEECVDMLNMQDFLHNRISNLSTGQTQKVNIARTFIHNPQYYVLDEITSGLDIISSQIILDFIKKLKAQGKTIFYSTHYMEEVELIADEVIILNQGKIIYTGTPKDLQELTKTTTMREAFFKYLGEDYEK